MAVDSNDNETWLLNLPPTPLQRRAGYCISIALFVGFLISAPFAAIALPRVEVFIPVIEALMFLTDFITAVLLFSQFSIYRSKALLVLSSGYLFTALMILPHLASFPSAFTPSGLFGPTIDTTGWLYYLWHIGLPITLLVYAYFITRKNNKNITETATSSAIAWSILLIVALVFALSWFAFASTRFLPHLFVDRIRVTPFLFYIGGFVLLMVLLATVVIWTIQRSVLDLWLFVVAVAATAEVGLITLSTGRFTLGFYVGRIFALVTSTTVLVVLLAETTRLYKHLARSNTMLQRERDNKLMNFEAIAAAIAHEMAQPLAAIAANGDAALEYIAKLPPDLDRAQDSLNDMIEASHRTAEAVDGIRALFRKTHQTLQQLDVNEIVADVLHSLRAELREQGIASGIKLASSIPLINGNKFQLHQVILNLVQNAIEAMASTSGQERTLRLSTQRQDPGSIIVAVQDTGPGIEPNRLTEIFEAFVTTKPQGTGLGLAICRSIIERHGGQLSAWSDGKNGALFQIVLPIESACNSTDAE